MNLLHSLYCGVVVLYDDVVVGIRGVEPRLKILIPDVRCRTGYWSTVVMYCAHRLQLVGIGIFVKYQ
jgi:hypothetical protein